ncbi:hypothetical protein [Microcystis sp.]
MPASERSPRLLQRAGFAACCLYYCEEDSGQQQEMALHRIGLR